VPKINIDEVPWTKWSSPKGKFSSEYKPISEALGFDPAAPGLGRHPFDITLERLAPGEISCPFHSHATQYELFYVVSGTGTVRLREGLQQLVPGDVILHPPGEAHAISNEGTEPLVYFLIADNPLLDYCEYPDSGKAIVTGRKGFLQPLEADYWDGEE
jgi:uncharacterized cupin superfamily protein